VDFAFLRGAVRSKAGQSGCGNLLLHCNMIKWQDIRCPKTVIMPNGDAV
jgi:hypothetical protein